jgi:hypothetical protein
MIRLLVAGATALLLLALPWQHQQRCGAQDHQPTTAGVQSPSVPATTSTALPSLPATAEQTGGGEQETWHYGDAIAPATWSNWALAIFAGIAAWIALRTLRSIRIQVKVEIDALKETRKDFSARYRPRIRVRNLALDLSTVDYSNEHAEQTVKVAFSVSNWGESRAQISQAIFYVHTAMSDLDPEPQYRMAKSFLNQIPNGRLESGAEVRITATGPQHKLLPVLQKNHRLYLVGRIDYRGPVEGAVYRTAFARRFVGQNRRFVIEENPDYEYEE